jgi:vacuolar-type H+-ATPase subunit C/Vma6
MTASLHHRQHAFGFGRVGVLQELLLSQADIERLLQAGSEKDLVKVISELKIASSVSYSSNPHQFIHAIECWLETELRHLVEEESAKDVFDILWMKDDTSFVSYLLKKHHGLTSAIASEPHVGALAFSKEMYQECIGKGDFSRAPASLALWMQFAEEQVKRATKISPLILRYVQHHIDLQNIRTAQRLAKTTIPVAPYLLAGGTIAKEHFTEDMASLASVVKNSDLKALLSSGSAGDDFILLERALVKEIAEDLAEMRSCILSIEPLFAFGAIAVSQLKVLRTILVGKSAGLASDEVKNLLPPFLSASPFAA